jgi:hypothetical protein
LQMHRRQVHRSLRNNTRMVKNGRCGWNPRS